MKNQEIVFELKSSMKKETLGRIVKKEFQTAETVHAKAIEAPGPTPFVPKFEPKYEPKIEPKVDPGPAPSPFVPKSDTPQK